MKILVIGSKGFIGKHLLQFLHSKNVECWGCDVFTDYNEERYFLADATNTDYSEIFSEQNFDVCINCSGAAVVPDSLVHPLRDFTLNTLNVVKLLDAIRRFSPTCRFVNMSSAAVYGNPQRLPISETDLTTPVSPYGVHKMQADLLCSEYSRFFNIHTCSVRIFSAYGDGLKKQLLWDLYVKSKQGNHVTLYGTGKESRDFIHISDIAKAILLIIKKGSFNGDVYNIANGKEVSIHELAAVFFKALSYKGTYSFSGDERKGDPVNWVADIGKIEALGYESSVSIESGVQQYIQWLKEEKLV